MPIYDSDEYDENKMYFVPPKPDEVKHPDHGFCPLCGKPLNKKSGPYGEFLGCSGYLNGCKYTEHIK